MLKNKKFVWTRPPKNFTITNKEIEIITEPYTDLWQRTYYHFRNDNAPLLQFESEDIYFSFVVKVEFEYKNRFDQCGIILYLDSENWLKASIEYENEEFQHLGTVVTNLGFSDWSTTEISKDINYIWYRLSRRESDFRLECSFDGKKFSQMRICHMFKVENKVSFGIYACSPENSSFKAVFKDLKFIECQWHAHDGQQPDHNL